MNSTPEVPLLTEPADALIAAHPELGALYNKADVAEKLDALAARLLTAGRFDQERRIES